MVARHDFDSYSIEIADDAISVALQDRRYALVTVGAAVDGVAERDIDEPLSAPDVTRDGDCLDVTWTTRSNLWRRKRYHWRFEKDLFWCQVSIEGEGTIGEFRYLDNGRKQSIYDFSRFFTPERTLLDQPYYSSMQYIGPDAPPEGSVADMQKIPRGGHLFIPPPLCYCLGFSSGPWLAVGVAPERGHYNFSRFNYMSGANSFCFRLSYEGMTEVSGEWVSPKLVFMPAETEHDGLEAYCDLLRQWGLVDENTHPRADWWSKPMFCGWGEQHICAIRGGSVQPNSDFASQEVYDGFIEIIREKRLNPGTIVIDDKWQKHYGTLQVDERKWPDLRGWVDARHAEGRRVLLWCGTVDPEGLPEDECARNAEGRIVFPDPTSPAYQRRIREMMHRLLSPDEDCYNADGIKVDWISVHAGEKYELHGDVCGIEMLKLLVRQIYDAAKAVKPDALIITHTANPYFAECTDMLRLNDMTDRAREVSLRMARRQRIARAACPHALIDCDNSCAPTHTEWMEYMKTQPSLGVPSSYFLTAVDGTMEPITDADWDELAHIWMA